MRKSILLALVCFSGMLTSCKSAYLLPNAASYISVRQKYAQPTAENPIPPGASIVAAYEISIYGDLTATVYNRTSNIMIIDQTKSFFVNTDGKSVSYFDPTVKTSTTTKISSGTKSASVNLGAVAGAFGLGGSLGNALNGINVGGANTDGTAVTEATYIADSPQISLAPNSYMLMTKEFPIRGLIPINNGGLEVSPYISQQNSPSRFSVCISYSLDGGKTFEQLVTEFYVDSYMCVPTKEEGKVNAALRDLETYKPDLYNEPWWTIILLGPKVSFYRRSYAQGIIFDYQ